MKKEKDYEKLKTNQYGYICETCCWNGNIKKYKTIYKLKIEDSKLGLWLCKKHWKEMEKKWNVK